MALDWPFDDGLCTGIVTPDGPLYQRSPGPVVGAAVPGGGAVCRSFSHRLADAGPGVGEVLEVEATFDAAPGSAVGFHTGVYPSASLGTTLVDLPKSIYIDRYHHALIELGDAPDPTRRLPVGTPGQSSGDLIAHYLEPSGSDPATLTTRHPLLLPVAVWHQPHVGHRVALFAPPDRPWQLACTGERRGSPVWSLTTAVTADDPRPLTLKAWLAVFPAPPAPPTAVPVPADLGDTANAPAYDAFHRLAHHEPHPVPGWLRDAKLHYFDFLSPESPSGRRGRGFEQNTLHFDEFSVGLATSHGYYPWWGDYLHPDRPAWTAMKGDTLGPGPMSLNQLRERAAATRAAGSRFGVYLHLVGFDRNSPLWPTLRDSVRTGPDGEPKAFGWDGPDMEGQAAFMSIASSVWSDHLLQQVRWVMELIDPDAIVFDETFAGIGHEHHPDRAGPISYAMIRFMRDLRSLVKSFGEDKAVLTSDCGMSPFALWADGEGGDHAYEAYLGKPAYRAAVGAYASVLHGKPWLPCAWRGVTFWNDQMDLARRIGTGVSIGNGWCEYAGLALLSPGNRGRVLADLATLAPSSEPFAAAATPRENAP